MTMARSIPLNPHYETRPVPDPTELTTRQLLREMASLKELMEVRFDATDANRALLRHEVSLISGATSAAVQRLQDLHEEKFASIATQFKERDVRGEQTQKDGKVAIDAALLAAKEAVSEQNKSNAISISKSETTFTKQIEQLGDTIRAVNKNFDERLFALTKSMDDKIGDIKDRVLSIESRTVGGHEMTAARNASNDNTTKILGVAFAGFIALMAAITWFGVGHSSSGGGAQPAAVAVVPVQPAPVVK